MKQFLTALCLLLIFSAEALSQHVSIGGNKFYVNGKEIFFTGINTAWQPQSDWSLDFLGRNFNYTWWNNEFQRYRDNRINLARVWLHGSGNYSPSLNGDGLVTGASSQFWQDMDNLVAISRQKQVYLMPTFWSFDMVKDGGTAWYYNQYRQIINDPNKTRWYIENFLVPFIQRYENEPYVMGYDIGNELEHMWRDADCGNLNRNNVVRFVAMCAAAINQYSNKPVTKGSMWIIFNSDRFAGWDTYAGNNYSNASLQAQYNNPNAYLDFWSPHWYQWQSSGGPFNTTIGEWLDNGNRPVLIGETPGYDITASSYNNCCNWNVSMADYYKQSYWNGYAGVCAWKNPHEDDNYGTFATIIPGTNDFYANYPHLVYPNTSSTDGIISGATYRIMARHSGRALDVDGGTGATANGANVHQWEYVGAANQHWVVTAVGDGYYSLVAVHSGKALDVGGWSTVNGGNVAQWTYEGKANQQWRIESIGSGYYRLINRHSSKALDVAGGTGATVNGANVHQWDYLGQSNQQWQFVQVVTSGGARMAADTEVHNTAISNKTPHREAYPNPFRDKTYIPLQLATAGTAEVLIYNSQGKLIHRLSAAHLEAGQHTLSWDGRNSKGTNARPGIYMYLLKMQNKQRVGRLIKLE